MIQQIKNIVMLLSAVCLIATLSAVPVVAQAEEQTPVQKAPVTNSIADHVCRGVLSAESGAVPQNATIQDCQENGDASFSFIVRRIINIFSVVVGAVSVIMIIIGGFRYIISGGDSSGVSGAKNTILYAIVGLIIVLFAQVIVRFILANAVPTA